MDEQKYQKHREVATQLESLYIEINKLATKKPADRLTPLISRKLNQLIVKVRELISDDIFLDAIETVSTEPKEQIRFDEALIVTSELRTILDKQWVSTEFEDFRREMGRRFDSQNLKG